MPYTIFPVITGVTRVANEEAYAVRYGNLVGGFNEKGYL